jgi:hypothetical protein
VAIVYGGEPQWNVAKVDVNKNQLPDYEELAKVGRSLGLVCGYWWKGKKIDPCHYETPEVVG